MTNDVASARDFVGYGETPPDVCWPGGARLAVNVVLNYEEGSEYSIEDGDGRSDATLTEVAQARVPQGLRDLAAESMFEYGSRVGFWRIYRLFRERRLPLTVFAQYRFGEASSAFRPYLGLGVTYAKFFGERTTAALNGLTGGTLANPTTASVDSKWGLTPQIGFVYQFNERWFVDVAYYKSFLKTTTHLSSGQSISLRLNPNVYAVGIGYRF